MTPPHTSLPARLYADLIGKPFADGARGPDVYDCLGLAIEIQRRRGFAVPDFVSSAEELHRQVAAGGFFDGCVQLAYPEPGCVVLMRGTGVAKRHFGVMVDRFKMLHASEPAGSVVVERLASSLWSYKVLGFYQLQPRLAPGLGAYPNPEDAAR